MLNFGAAVRLALVASLAAGPLFAQKISTPSVTLRGFGDGVDEKAAIQDALSDLIVQAVGTIINSETVTKYKSTIVERVLPRATDVITSHEVLKTAKEPDGKVSVRVKGTVDRVALAGKLADAGIPVPEVIAKDPEKKESLPPAEPKARPSAHGSEPKLPTLNAQIVKGCEQQLGKQVGNGECADLPTKAYRQIGARLPTFKEPNGDYVWGKLVYYRPADGLATGTIGDCLPGDIIQLRDFRMAGAIGTHHTAIVRAVDAEADTLKVWEQNTSGKRFVQEHEYRLSTLKTGWIRVYRPQPK